MFEPPRSPRRSLKSKPKGDRYREQGGLPKKPGSDDQDEEEDRKEPGANVGNNSNENDNNNNNNNYNNKEEEPTDKKKKKKKKETPDNNKKNEGSFWPSLGSNNKGANDAEDSNDESDALLADELNRLRSDVQRMKKDLKKMKSTDRHGSSSGSDFNDEGDDGIRIRSGDEDDDVSLGDAVDTDETLPSDTFSFLIISTPGTIPFFLPIVVWVYQVSIFVLVAFDIFFGNENSKNPLGLPVNVNRPLRLTQFLAIVVAVITQDDIRTGISHLREGFNKESLVQAFNIGRNIGSHPGPYFHVSAWKWYVAAVARLIEGSLGLVVTFFLIVRSETVIDLLLNFTAMGFVSQLDEVFFFLSHEGFAGRTNMKTAEAIEETPYHRENTAGRGVKINRMVLFSLILMAMLAGWGVTIYSQTSGQLLCSTVFVQFGDDFIPALGSFSGFYDRKPGATKFYSDERTIFLERRRTLLDDTDKVDRRGMFGYCPGLNAWTFSYIDANGSRDPCKSWHARSDRSSTFDLPETAGLEWFVRNKDNREISLTPFRLDCYDCDRIADSDQACSGHGSCSGSTCTCIDGWYGLHCEFREPCPSLQLDIRFDGFPVSNDVSRSEWSHSYAIFQAPETNAIVESYHRPVYISEYQPNLFDIVFFTGRRWVITGSSDLFDLDLGGRDSRSLLANYFLNDFHAYWSTYSVYFVSGPMDVNTALDSDTPAGLQWFYAEAKTGWDSISLDTATAEAAGEGYMPSTVILGVDKARPIESLLLCAQCDDNSNPCQYNGQCVNGECECPLGATGTLCENAPIGNGRCEPHFNSIEFRYDGGDCCESTCVSTQQYTCGRDETGYVNVGYFHCHLKAEPKWNLHGLPISGREALIQSGSSVALSGTGSIIAVGERGSDSVTLYDKDGSGWEQRWKGQGVSHSGFGSLVVTSVAGTLDMVNNPSTRIPIVLAVAATQIPDNPFQVDPSLPSSSTYVRIFECELDCKFIRPNLNDFFVDTAAAGTEHSYVKAIDLSSDGSIVAISSFANVPIDGTTSTTLMSVAVVYERDFASTTNNHWKLRSRIQYQDEVINDLSLSGSGIMLVLQLLDEVGSTSSSYTSSTETYIWQEDSSMYREVGLAIIHVSSHDGKHNSISLADSGNELAVASSNVVDIYRWDRSVNEWVPLGSTITVPTPVNSVALSMDGSTVAIDRSVAASTATVTSTANNMVVVETNIWNGNFWEPKGQSIVPGGRTATTDGGSGSDGSGGGSSSATSSRDSTMTMSADGSVVAIGLPYGGVDATGTTYVYAYPSVNCPNGLSLLRLTLTTDDAPNDITWTIVRNGNEPLLRGGPYDHAMSTYVDEVCIPNNDCVTFTINDGNVASVGGTSYTILVNGEQVNQDILLSASASYSTGSC